ncbi:MAG: glycosyltransferase family 2 protein [Bacteroidota bacterium]
MNSHAPIALFVYNRADHTRLTIEALQRNGQAAESDLFIFSDAAKIGSPAEKVLDVRRYISTVTGFKSVTITERAENFGLSRSIIDGVTMLVNRFGSVIVVEDDLIVSPHFLRYMNDALNIYRDEQGVISIHGYVYPVRRPLPETFFIQGADCWGWATWKRGWELFESDGKKLLKTLTEKNLLRQFDFNGSYPYETMLKRQIAGTVDSWAVRWYASAFLNDKVTLYPGRTLVQNIGGDEFGTHTKSLTAFHGTLSTDPITVIKQPPVENAAARTAFAEFFHSIRPTFRQRVRSKIQALFGL